MTHEPTVSSEDIRTSYCPLIYIKKTFIALSFNIYYTGEKKEKRKTVIALSFNTLYTIYIEKKNLWKKNLVVRFSSHHVLGSLLVKDKEQINGQGINYTTVHRTACNFDKLMC